MVCCSYCKKFYKENTLFLDNLKGASCVENLFYILDDSPFFNFLSLELLHRLAKIFELNDLLTLMNGFKSAYANVPFKEILLLPGIQRFNVEGDENIDLVKVKTKLIDDVTYSYVAENFVCSLSSQVLQVDVGCVLPHKFWESSIIIKFLIPFYLKNFAIQSAFCSMEVLSKLKIAFIEIDAYRIECISENITGK